MLKSEHWASNNQILKKKTLEGYEEKSMTSSKGESSNFRKYSIKNNWKK